MRARCSTNDLIRKNVFYGCSARHSRKRLTSSKGMRLLLLGVSVRISPSPPLIVSQFNQVPRNHAVIRFLPARPNTVKYGRLGLECSTGVLTRLNNFISAPCVGYRRAFLAAGRSLILLSSKFQIKTLARMAGPHRPGWLTKAVQHVRGHMAKRFTDTDKWKRPWFSELSIEAKLVWFYLLDDCDATGVWVSNFKRVSFDLGFTVSRQLVEQWFGDKLVAIASDKYAIPSFIEFQYGTEKELNPENNAHKGPLKLLERLRSLAPDQPLTRSSPGPHWGAQDKEEDKDKDKDLDKDQDKEKEKSAAEISKSPGGVSPEAKAEWEKTLSHYGLGVNWARDESPIYRAYQRTKSWDRVRNALAGFRFEPKGKDYDPATNVYAHRLLEAKKFDRLESIGEQGLAGKFTGSTNAGYTAEEKAQIFAKAAGGAA